MVVASVAARATDDELGPERDTPAVPYLAPRPVVSVEQLLTEAETAAADEHNPNRERDARVAAYFRQLATTPAREVFAHPGDDERIAAARQKRARKAARRAELAGRK